jgi:hypothetical protein
MKLFEVKSLEDEIEDLEKLDELRIRSARMRDQGRAVLRSEKKGVEKGWHDSPNAFEDAVIVKALCDRKEGPLPARVRKLEAKSADEILNDEHLNRPENSPILRAARSMQALAAAPDSAFSEALLVYYYQIVREIYTADQPDWHIGGARAGNGGRASAFVTGECVRAILGYARTLENTGRFLEAVNSALVRKAQLESPPEAACWQQVELMRLRRSFHTSISSLLDNIAFRLELSAEEKKELQTDATDQRIDDFLNRAPKLIEGAVVNAHETFTKVKEALKKHREREDDAAKSAEWAFRERASPESGLCRSPARKRFERSATGDAVAFGAIEQGFKTSKLAAELFTEDPAAALSKLEKMFFSVAEGVRRLIQPARSYLSTVLDRELTAFSSEARPGWDPAEMGFAAASYGFAASFDDDRLRRAGNCLCEALSARGSFPHGKPFYSNAEGYHIDVIGAEVLRVFAQLLQNVSDIPVSQDLVRRMLLFFEDNQRRFPEEPESYGWSLEGVQETARPTRWVTALSVLALDHINRMLDSRINIQVFRHFSVKKEKDLKVPLLADLFYPDYGLRNGSTPSGKHAWEQEESVALTLEKMRSHVLGLSSRNTTSEPLFSLILHGPPGTGKTTLVEALAKASDVPLVEITPSDIVSSGADVVERRARAVFRALALLTRAVILFDEFDPVLRSRDRDAAGPSTVFTFVTPGMLPKLKRLHDTAKGRRVAYVLITNHIGMLDRAAIRSGRFDRKVGIYPPDPLSRAGRLYSEAFSIQRITGKPLPQDRGGRVLQILKKTTGAPMEALTRPGWFVAPKNSSVPPGSPLAYLTGQDKEEFRQIVAEAEPEPPGDDEISRHEWRQWEWIRRWETRLDGANDLAAALEAPDQIPAIESLDAKPQALYFALSKPPEGGPYLPLYLLTGKSNGDSPAPSIPDATGAPMREDPKPPAA